MRKTITLLAVTAALAAAPALAKPGNGNGGGHGGGGHGGGMGAGPPMSVPGRSMDPRGAAHDIAAQRGEFGRQFAYDRRMSQAERTTLYRTRSEQRRAAALARADAARMGRGRALTAREIRNDLRADMEEWRDAFRLGRADWHAARDRWLADKDSLTAQQWAARRDAWFAERDQWIATQRAWASNRRN